MPSKWYEWWKTATKIFSVECWVRFPNWMHPCNQHLDPETESIIFFPEHLACPQQGLPLYALVITQVSFLLSLCFRYKWNISMYSSVCHFFWGVFWYWLKFTRRRIPNWGALNGRKKSFAYCSFIFLMESWYQYNSWLVRMCRCNWVETYPLLPRFLYL